jgi:VWFA-related protein
MIHRTNAMRREIPDSKSLRAFTSCAERTQAFLSPISLLLLIGSFLAAMNFPSGLILQFPSSASAQTKPFQYGVKVELVGLYATVHDRTGKLVTSLNQTDFVIYDQDAAQPITQFSREYIPLAVSILLDTSGSMAGKKLDHARQSLLQFLKRLNPGDEALLMTIQTKPRLIQDFTQELDVIRRPLKQLDGFGSTALYDAILMALDQTQRSQNRRRALLLISDAINTYGKARLDETVASLRRKGIELFAIGLDTAVPASQRDQITTKSVLDQLTRSAGGISFIIDDSKDLSRICSEISEQMHNQYSFGYYPPKTKEGEWRTIRLETKNPRLRVVASKTGYYASPNR